MERSSKADTTWRCALPAAAAEASETVRPATNVWVTDDVEWVRDG